jgi:hypothetical protein
VIDPNLLPELIEAARKRWEALSHDERIAETQRILRRTPKMNDDGNPQDKLSIGGALALAFGASALLYAVFFTILARI